MSDLEVKECIGNAESFQSIQQIFRMIELNKNLIATSDTFLGSEATFLSFLKELIGNRLDNNADESENYLELFVTNQLYAMTIQIHSLSDLCAQLIYELGLVTLASNGTPLTIDKVNLSKVKQELTNDTTGSFSSLLNTLTCFDDENFTYFASLSNTLKHKFLPVTNIGGHAISGSLAETGFQVDTFVVHEAGAQRAVEAKYLPQIINNYNSFKTLIDSVFIELNNIVN